MTKYVPFKGVLAFCAEEIDMVFEHQLENVVLADGVTGVRLSHL